MLLNILIILNIIIGFIYLILMSMSYKNSTDKVLAISPWWSFSPSNFDEQGQKSCKYGRLLVYISVLITFVIFYIKP